MEGFYDIHCHMLPGVDDGAQNMQETEQMLEVAYSEGIRNVIFTPHYHPRRGHADAKKIEAAFEQVKNMVADRFPDMNIYTGNELYYDQDVKQRLKEGEVLPLAGSKYVLLEFSGAVERKKIRDAVGTMLMSGYLPVIAHVERYESLFEKKDALETVLEMGAYFQVNASAVLGDLGRKRKKQILKMMENGMVHFVATDAHDGGVRAPKMKKVAGYLEKKLGLREAKRLLVDNPECIIKNKII